MSEPPAIRPAERKDAPAICAIYNHWVATSLVTFDEDPWTAGQWDARLVDLAARGLPALVAEDEEGSVLGYALAAPWSTKHGYRFTAEDSIYLSPEATGRGVGGALMAALVEESAECGLRELVAVVADEQAEASLALHGRFGFVETGRLAGVGVKFGRRVGVVYLQRSLLPPVG